MTNNNNNGFYIPKEFKLNLPATATVSFYDVETDTNLSLAEWKALNNNTGKVKIINQGEPYRSWKVDTDEPSYGPCSSSKCTCYISSGFVPLNSACPGCSGTVPHEWVHSSCWGRMYISRNLRIQCMNCYDGGHWKDWAYRCERHQEYKQATSAKAFLTALNIAVGMNATDDGTVNIISEIAIKLIQEGRNS